MRASDSSDAKSQPYQVFMLALCLYGLGVLTLVYLSTLKMTHYRISEGEFHEKPDRLPTRVKNASRVVLERGLFAFVVRLRGRTRLRYFCHL